MEEHVGAGDLAALLRELKGRSGLSYGALAKRLHMSTSTLHRYVNGTAVPTEFAPVERFARACRATPEELVEVHRRWIVADAARGRRGAERAPQRPEPQPVPGAERVPPDGPEAEPGSGSQPLPAAESAPESAPAAEAAAGAAATAPSAAPDGTAPPAGPARPANRARRTAALVGAGVALALGATVLAVQGGFLAPKDDRAGAVAEASPDGAGPSVPGKQGAGGGPNRSPGGTAGPGSGHGAGKHDTGKGADGVAGDAGGTASPGSTRQDGGTPATGTPVTVSTQPQYWDSPCGSPYLIDRAPAGIAPPPNEQDAPGWVSANGAVSAGRQSVRLTVQGIGGGTVVLEALHVRVAGTDAPLPWNDYAMGYIGVGCGGNVPKHSFDVNLDASVPRLTPEEGTNDDFPYTVSADDPETFYVNAAVKDHHVRWYLELQWSSGNRHGTVRIDDTGRPFRTSGEQGRPQYGYSLDKKRWVPIRREPNGTVTELPEGT
ncbi:helix-turn-helix transcriptional regulator [Streptomyces sp. NPDC039016]|uniref:helix-turn-helix transcriptional regulator n=1 Tax=Streptomyces sp. NPDC039016 TaxID=3154330 RepID=UPI0033DBBBCB